jgi:hypothetical protein
MKHLSGFELSYGIFDIGLWQRVSEIFSWELGSIKMGQSVYDTQKWPGSGSQPNMIW